MKKWCKLSNLILFELLTMLSGYTMLYRSFVIVVVGLSSLACVPQASAEIYTRQVNGKELVVHTNTAPVIVHRILPPFHGKHVTERQLKAGRLPPAARR